jgi:preprotein translocase subunit SecG
MLSLLGKSLLAIIVVLIVALVTLILVDEKSGSSAVSVCKLRDGSSVVVRIIYHSAIARMLRFLTGNQLFAITFWNRVYVSSNYLVPHAIQHELEHVRQWHALGPVSFTVQYLWDFVRYGYAKHPLEVSARLASGDTLR